MHLFKIKSYTTELAAIIAVQNSYPKVEEAQVYIPQEVNSVIEEALKQNNPNRFLPPETAEEARKKWGRK